MPSFEKRVIFDNAFDELYTKLAETSPLLQHEHIRTTHDGGTLISPKYQVPDGIAHSAFPEIDHEKLGMGFVNLMKVHDEDIAKDALRRVLIIRRGYGSSRAKDAKRIFSLPGENGGIFLENGTYEVGKLASSRNIDVNNSSAVEITDNYASKLTVKMRQATRMQSQATVLTRTI